ncbi:conjugal transfer protein TraF [Helicobacter cappadocius]|uniref:Conjugal transfer protein TraF n=1 Tax=Helicobacter cappadocius TaxID=3063998 RepID=A0AA90TEX7_9HELI|nr:MULTISPECIES: conjugal transfer protein TraF [unclassified Helicobacter]MDO7252935.1 conjugal transfer protein TraF [Helicobacter sp. faydin-H75]MDP2539075.1 conjugal transfer protein TraF [Helicobacter sp. faydin-H76]
MKKISKIIIMGSLFGMGLDALEFGSMGNISTSMGGAGVALRNSQWALYYNPALLGMDRKSRFAYSFGANVRETNLLGLANINVDDVKNISVGSHSSSGISGAFLTGASGVSSGGNADVFKELGDIKTLLGNAIGGAQGSKISSATSIDDAIKQFKAATLTDGSLNSSGLRAFDYLQTQMLDAIDKSGEDTGILKSVVKNLTPSQVNGIADLIQKGDSGNVNVGDVLSALGSVKLTPDGATEDLIKNISSIKNALDKNDLSANTQNGLVGQIGGNGPDGRGAIAFGVFGSAFISASASFDPSHNQIIASSDGSYVKVDINDNEIVLSNSTKADYDNHSILSDSAQHQLHVTGLTLGEIPIGYGQAFSTPIGNFSIGFVAKYIFALGESINKTGSFSSISDGYSGNDFGSISPQNTFGIDIGGLYNYGGFNIGIVAKDINSPSISVNDNQKIILDPQVRAGISYEWRFLSLAMDMDLKPNNTLSYLSPKNQMIGGGVMFDFKYIDLRFGSMYDLASKAGEGVILTGGINILGFLDLALQSNLKLTDVSGTRIPSYISLKVGGGFSW